MWGLIGINTNPIRYNNITKYSQNCTTLSLDILTLISSLNIRLVKTLRGIEIPISIKTIEITKRNKPLPKSELISLFSEI